MLKKLMPALLMIGCCMAGPAFAHPGHGPDQGLLPGLAHPLSGIDHVIAMVAVGLYAACLGGRALWLVPASFVAAMIVGGAFGFLGVPVPLVETGIGLSVLVLSIAVALGVRLSTVSAMALAGGFALFHGHAHGSEAIGLTFASFLSYAAGFVVSTTALHVGGIALGLGLARMEAQTALWLRRAAGAAGALAGIAILSGNLTA